jgi:hypothetical protein
VQERTAIGFALMLIGLLLIHALLPVATWSWVLWIGVGGLAGWLVGRARYIWLAWLATGAAYGLGIWLGFSTPPGDLVFGLIAVALAGLLPGAGFILGTASRWDSSLRRLTGAVALACAMVFGYALFLGVVGAGLWVASDKSHDCRTPAIYGWTYEAINYDQADDANPQAGCEDRASASTGVAVVSEDGTPIAGWYIPAASGSGPQGATLVIVPGGKSSKSEMLKYAELLHDRYNLVMMDMRGEGRSGGQTSLGLRERSDVAAMIDWVASTKHPTWIGGMGVSMGAGSLLGAAARDERVKALVLDSMHATYEQSTGTILEREWGQPAEPGVWGIRAVGLLTLRGDVSDADPSSAITRLGDRPVLLLHSDTDHTDRVAYSAELNLRAGQEAGVPVQLVRCSGPDHGELINEDHAACRSEWIRSVDSFLASALAGEASH